MNLRIATRTLGYCILVLFWANHCLASEFLWEVSEKSADHSQNIPCHGHRQNEKHDSDSKPAGSHHSKCLNDGCCQPAVHTAEFSFAQAVNTQANLDLDLILRSLVCFNQQLVLNKLALYPTGPPVLGVHETLSHIFSLSLAPNAPPLA